MKYRYQEKLWFKKVKEDKKNYSTIKLIEKDKISRDKIKKPLIETLIHYYIPEKIMKFYLDENEYMSKLEHVINGYLPSSKQDNTRKGDFSEIISSEHLIQNYDYYFPYIKLQNKINKETSNHGDDILCFKFNKEDEINEICVGEVKFRSDFNNNIFKKAHKQLKSSYDPEPKSLRMVVNYTVKKNDKHSEQLIKLLNDETFLKTKKSNWIFCVTEKSHDTIDIYDEKEFLENLTLVSIYLPHISTFIHEIYDLSSGFYNEQ